MGKCMICKKFLGIFRREHTCEICDGTLCHDCAVKIDTDSKEKIVTLIDLKWPRRIDSIDREWHKEDDIYLCPVCHSTYTSKLRTTIENTSRIGKENVRLYSSRYQGKLPKHTEEIQLKTFYHRDRNEAEDEIKVYAASLGCRDVIGVHYNKKSIEDGNYIYSVFQYEGKGIK